MIQPGEDYKPGQIIDSPYFDVRVMEVTSPFHRNLLIARYIAVNQDSADGKRCDDEHDDQHFQPGFHAPSPPFRYPS